MERFRDGGLKRMHWYCSFKRGSVRRVEILRVIAVISNLGFYGTIILE